MLIRFQQIFQIFLVTIKNVVKLSSGKYKYAKQSMLWSALMYFSSFRHNLQHPSAAERMNCHSIFSQIDEKKKTRYLLCMSYDFF